ncbi:hypothetical protein L1987_71151 [Smallanthus sonchifolius]|uniref:Uncharacterized protein n=1 Tax=Smallanthus sonchifolius TaxID=185202 RepID=A0ACB9ASA2_9ASTR|nr:hypothetical protein L1987_71151 [Smallanthus sonchifolius]
MEMMRDQIPMALAARADPTRFVLRRSRSLVPVMVDPIVGKSRVLVTPSVKKTTKEIAQQWKESFATALRH